jgi:hypothetical protein
MKYNPPLLERWVQFHDTLVGYVFDAKQFSPGTRVQTEVIRFVDLLNGQAECADGKYRLGEPGTFEEHDRIIGIFKG